MRRKGTDIEVDVGIAMIHKNYVLVVIRIARIHLVISEVHAVARVCSQRGRKGVVSLTLMITMEVYQLTAKSLIMHKSRLTAIILWNDIALQWTI